MRGADQIDLARVDHDEFCTLAQALLHARCEYRMGVGWVCANEQNDIGVFDRLEVLRAGGSTEGVAQAETGRRVAHACARVDVVVSKCCAHHLLHHEHFFVGATRRTNCADRVEAVLGLNCLQACCGERNGFLEGNLLPFIRDGFANHWL